MADGRRRTAAAALFAACIFLIPPAWGTKFTVGPWTVEPYRDEKSGAFTHCSAKTIYRETEVVVFGLAADDSLQVILYNEAWKLRESDSYEVNIMVDSEALGTFTAVVLNSSFVAIGLPDTERRIRQFGGGRAIRIQTPKQELVYVLDDVGAALTGLQKCVSEEHDPEPVVRDLFGGGGGALRSWTDRETEEARVAELLDNAGLSDFGFLPPRGRRGSIAQAYYAWVKGKTIGAYFVYERTTATLDGTATGRLLDYEDNCSGEFTYAAREDVFANGQPVRRALATCDYGHEKYRISFLFYETDNLVIAIIHFADSSAEADLHRADEAMFRFFGAGE